MYNKFYELPFVEQIEMCSISIYVCFIRLQKFIIMLSASWSRCTRL